MSDCIRHDVNCTGCGACERDDDMKRIVVAQFANEMQKQLEENKHKDEIGWLDCDFDFLIERMENNIIDIQRLLIARNACKTDELQAEFKRDIIKSTADVGNYAMMIADKVRKEWNG